jgi:MFS family permease
MLVALFASIPDRVVPARRGAIGALVGAATIVGGVAGNVLAARFADRIEIGVAVFAGVLVAGAVAFGVFGGERRGPTARATSAPAAAGAVAGGRADFVWFSIARFALFLGYAAVTGLAYYVLRDHIGRDDPANGVAAFAVVTGVATLAASLVAGIWSDRVNRRKPFVVAASAVLGIGLLFPIASPTLAAFLVAAAVIGLGFGAYLAVGTALGTLVLPSAESSGRDLGYIGLANASAQAVAPVAGSYVAATLGYPVLFGAAATACLVAALAVLPIRSVR